MKESLRRIAEIHGFQLDVAEKMWAKLGSLEKTSEALKNMREAAEAVGGKFIVENVELAERIRREEDEEEERARVEDEEMRRKMKRMRNGLVRRSLGFEYTPVNGSEEQYHPPEGSRAAEMKRQVEERQASAII